MRELPNRDEASQMSCLSRCCQEAPQAIHAVDEADAAKPQSARWYWTGDPWRGAMARRAWQIAVVCRRAICVAGLCEAGK